MPAWLSPDADVFRWVVLPALIFLARLLDVSLGTMRIISVARGRRLLAPALGFVEVIIWLAAMGQIVRNLTNPLYYVAYGAGFAAGNFVGILLEERLALGSLIVRVITQRDAGELVALLREKGYGVTTVNAQGAKGPVQLVFSVIRRRDVQAFLETLQAAHPKAFYSVEEVRSVAQGIFPMLPARPSPVGWLPRRKAK